jgi:hypothetical protein
MGSQQIFIPNAHGAAVLGRSPATSEIVTARHSAAAMNDDCDN